MIDLKEHLNKHLRKSFLEDASEYTELYLVEGINVDKLNKTVSLTDSHNKGVDFTLENNPIYDNINGIDVISIFKRSKIDTDAKKNLDGNPFIYALKGKDDWKFDITDEEITRYIRRFLQVCKKIKGHYDTIITIPSSSDINKKFMKVISRQVKSEYNLEGLFSKLSIETIINNDLIDIEQIKKDYPNSKKADDVVNEIYDSLDKMPTDDFEAKRIRKKYLKYIKYITLGDKINAMDKINDKDILILDDIMSSGTTISQCVENIRETFLPKSITVITLLSALKDQILII